jgi:hypothetical protein
MEYFFEELKEDYVTSQSQLTFREVWETFKRRMEIDKSKDIQVEFSYLMKSFGAWLAMYEDAKCACKYDNWSKEDLRKEIDALNEIVERRLK